MSRRKTVEIAREAEVHWAFGYPWRRYFGDMGFPGRKSEALRRSPGRPRKSLSPTGGGK